MYQFEFTGRAPSKNQIMSHIRRAMSDGHTTIMLVWGENEISIEKRFYNDFFGSWFGSGWIRKVGGDDIAQELSSRSIDKFFPSLKDFPTIRGA